MPGLSLTCLPDYMQKKLLLPILTLLLILGSGMYSMLQAQKRLPTEWGISVGVHHSRFLMKRLIEYRGAYQGNGYDFEAYVNLPYSIRGRQMSLRLGAQFSALHAQGVRQIDTVATEVDVNLGLLRLPIQFQFLFRGFAVRPFIQGGANVAFPLYRRGEIRRQEQNLLSEFLVSNVMVGAVLGTGLRIPLQEKLNLTIEARYSFNSINIFDYVSSFQALVGVTF